LRGVNYMLTNEVMFKIQGANQKAKLAGLPGNHYTVSKATITTPGVTPGKWLVLKPAGSTAAAGAGAVSIKLEGARQKAQAASMVGKHVTVGNSPIMIGGQSQWLVLTPTVKGAAVGAAAGSHAMLMKLANGRDLAQIPGLAGKSFKVMSPPLTAGGNAKKVLVLKPLAGGAVTTLKITDATAAELAPLTGKTVTVGKAPLAKGAVNSKWILVKPASAAKAAVITGGGAAAKAKTGVAAGATKAHAGVAAGAAKVKTGAAATKAGAAAGAASTTTKATEIAKAGTTLANPITQPIAAASSSGTIWSGTGTSLGLGLGLGIMGPILVVGAGVAAGLAVRNYLRKSSKKSAK
jgi:hypothetical protein